MTSTRTPENLYKTLTIADGESESTEAVLPGGRLVHLIPQTGLAGNLFRILVPDGDGAGTFVPLAGGGSGSQVNILFVVGTASAVDDAAPALLTVGRFKLETMTDATTKQVQTGAQTVVVVMKGYTS